MRRILHITKKSDFQWAVNNRNIVNGLCSSLRIYSYPTFSFRPQHVVSSKSIYGWYYRHVPLPTYPKLNQ